MPGTYVKWRLQIPMEKYFPDKMYFSGKSRGEKILYIEHFLFEGRVQNKIKSA